MDLFDCSKPTDLQLVQIIIAILSSCALAIRQDTTAAHHNSTLKQKQYTLLIHVYLEKQ